MNGVLSTKIKETYNGTTYSEIRGRDKEELFDNIYMYFKSNQYCWQVDREFVDKDIEKEYKAWASKNSENLWWKHATGRDFD
jgi:hypothetical protein